MTAANYVKHVYVVADIETRTLVGVVTLRDLVVKDDQSLLTDVMRRDVVAVDPLESGVAAARRVVDEHLAALPVVSRDGRLLGAITVDAAVAMLAPATLRNQVPRVFS